MWQSCQAATSKCAVRWVEAKADDATNLVDEQPIGRQLEGLAALRLQRRQRTQDAAVTRGLNATISEGLEIESEQFARMVPTFDIREVIDASMSQTALRTVGRW